MADTEISPSDVDVDFGSNGPVPQNDNVVGVRLPARLYGSKTLHRLVPARWAIKLIGLLGLAARQRRNPGERWAAENFMGDLLLHTARAAEAPELAQRWLIERSISGELAWRPWLLRRSRISGREHWAEAHSDGRACLVVTAHFSATWATFSIFALHGLHLYGVASQRHWQPMPPGYEGLQRLHRRREYIEKRFGASRVIVSEGPPERLLELLEARESVGIAFDVGGWAPTPFLGRSVSLAGGVATAAFKAKAMVLPAVPIRSGARIDLRLMPPIDPRNFSDPRALRAAIAHVFERVVLEQPEMIDLPWCRNAVPQWTRTRNWTTALLAFKIHFGDRLPD